ncbi:hypothetical protein BDB00DRAFT_810978 [Zychaea mexicana]|uniref:uncharacterized protein n=1 Tax=Zychaea mexicana TaxID=64656 RepID=UPI0022FECFA5|nr:uncharacterized protein BDB00DRAFT_810978 [Zychaea mexicana]KAI9495925.1 hypothetical protein BDB00DRAFT_810978 [Zychaea mexicana]
MLLLWGLLEDSVHRIYRQEGVSAIFVCMLCFLLLLCCCVRASAYCFAKHRYTLCKVLLSYCVSHCSLVHIMFYCFFSFYFWLCETCYRFQK